LLSCPWGNADPKKIADLVGEPLRQLCQVCGVDGELVDEDARATVFSGVVAFGPAHISGEVREEHISAYRVYAADVAGGRLGDGPLAEVPRRSEMPAGEGCCSSSAYRVRVTLELADNYERCERFLIVLVAGGRELPIGAITPPLQDDATAADCGIMDCAAERTGYVFRALPPTRCDGAACAVDECCEPFVGAVALEGPVPQQASSAIAIAIIGALLVCCCCAFALRNHVGSPCACLVAARDGKNPSFTDARDMFSVTPGVDGQALGAESYQDVEDPVVAEQMRAKSTEAKRRAAEAQGLARRRLENLQQTWQNQEQLESALSVFLGVLHSVIANPDDPRFRRLDRSNDRLRELLFVADGIDALVQVAGFRLQPKTDSFVLKDGPAHLATAKVVAEVLESFLAEMWEHKWKAQAEFIFPGVLEESREEALPA